MNFRQAYWMVTTPEKARWGKVKAFIAWLKEEAAAQRVWPPDAQEEISPER